MSATTWNSKLSAGRKARANARNRAAFWAAATTNEAIGLVFASAAFAGVILGAVAYFVL